MTTERPNGARRGKPGKSGRRFRFGAVGALDLAAALAALGLDDGGLEVLLARRVERQWLARGVLSVRPLTRR